MKTASAIAMLILDVAHATAASADGVTAAELARRVRAIHTPHSIAVGLRDCDLIVRRHPDLKGLVTFLDAKGRTIDSFLVDWSHEATPSQVVFTKRGQVGYARAAIRLTSNGRLVLEKVFDVPPPVASAGRAQLTDEVADLVPGTAFEEGTAPAVKLFDYERVPAVSLPQPSRSIARCTSASAASLVWP